MARWDTYDRTHETRATRRDQAHLKRRAKAQDDITQIAYEEGKKEALAEQRRKENERKNREVKRRARGVGREFARPVRQGGGQAVRELQTPVRRQVAGGLRTAGLTLAVVGLYLFLESAPAVSGALGGVNKAVDWLRAPDRSIRFAKEAS